MTTMTYSTPTDIASKKENSGVLFKNDRKESEQHSDYSGELDIAGVKYWLNGWVRTSKKTGMRFLSLTAKPKGSVKARADFNDDIGL
jgi:hypothetical protein